MLENDSPAKIATDRLGIETIGKAVNEVTEASDDPVGALLSRVCLPAAEEFGLLFRNQVCAWRQANANRIVEKTSEALEKNSVPESATAHPRLVCHILQEGSWNDDPMIQDLWAGLLASSCTEEGDDDSNLMFASLLENLTKMQTRMLKHLVVNGIKVTLPNGLIAVKQTFFNVNTVKDIAEETDIHRLDRELGHLRELGLIHGGFNRHTVLEMAPSALALNLYVRCQGSRLNPVEFFIVNAEGE